MNATIRKASEWPLEIADLDAFKDGCHRRAVELREQAMDDAFALAGAAVRKVWGRAAHVVRATFARAASAIVNGA